MLQWIPTVIGLGGQFVLSVHMKYSTGLKENTMPPIFHPKTQQKHKELMISSVTLSMISCKIHIFFFPPVAVFALNPVNYLELFNETDALLFFAALNPLSNHKAQGFSCHRYRWVPGWPQNRCVALACSLSHPWQDTLTQVNMHVCMLIQEIIQCLLTKEIKLFGTAVWIY